MISTEKARAAAEGQTQSLADRVRGALGTGHCTWALAFWGGGTLSGTRAEILECASDGDARGGGVARGCVWARGRGTWTKIKDKGSGRHMWGVGYVVLNYDLTTAD